MRHHNKSYDFENNDKYRKKSKKKSAEMREEKVEAIPAIIFLLKTSSMIQ